MKPIISGTLILILNLTVIGAQGLFAQQTVIPTGGDASTSTGSLSYSVGQLDYAFQHGSSGRISQGVQQPYEITLQTIVGVDPNLNPFWCKVYPNPVSERLTLQIETWQSEQFSYQLIGLNGTVLKSGKAENTQTTIPVTDLAPGPYFLRVSMGSIDLSTFNIIIHH